MAKAKAGSMNGRLVAGEVPKTKMVVLRRKDAPVRTERGPMDLLPHAPWAGPPLPKIFPGWPDL